MIDIVALLYRHRVDLGPKHYRRTLFPSLEDCRQSGVSELRDEFMRLERLNKTLNDLACLDLLAGVLGVRVDLTPQGHELGHDGRVVHGPSVRRLNIEVDTLSLFSID